jgi:hypothetical protein
MVEADAPREIVFAACHDPVVGERYARSFFEGFVAVGPNGISSKRLWNVGGSTPILDGLMQLAAIKTAICSSDRNVVVTYSLWDCFVGTQDYMDSMVSMWKFLYKTIREAGIDKITFIQLVDGTRKSDPRQQGYWKFYATAMSSIKGHWRRNIIVLDENIITNLGKWN